MQPDPFSPGQTVTVVGAGFQFGLSLSIGGIPVVPSSVDEDRITFVAPTGATSCGTPIQVTNPDGQTTSAASNAPPQITSLSPASGPAAGGTAVQIVGEGFDAMASVTINNIPLVGLSVVSPNVIQGTTPPGILGPATLVVRSSRGCIAVSGFQYTP